MMYYYIHIEYPDFGRREKLFKLKINKWYSLFASLFYLIYVFITYTYEGAGFIEYVNLGVNSGIVLLISIWLVSKSVVNDTSTFIILFALILYLFVLQSLVTYINVPYYVTQEFIGEFYVNVERINLIPFKTICSNLFGGVVAPVTIIQTVGNLLLLLPLAFGLLSLQIINNKNKVGIIIFLTTVLIELYQLFDNFIASGFMYSEGGSRAVDIDDIILNTIGGLMGIVLFNIYKRVFTSQITNRKSFISN